MTEEPEEAPEGWENFVFMSPEEYERFYLEKFGCLPPEDVRPVSPGPSAVP